MSHATTPRPPHSKQSFGPSSARASCTLNPPKVIVAAPKASNASRRLVVRLSSAAEALDVGASPDVARVAIGNTLDPDVDVDARAVIDLVFTHDDALRRTPHPAHDGQIFTHVVDIVLVLLQFRVELSTHDADGHGLRLV
jgi:hypothetical protein